MNMMNWQPRKLTCAIAVVMSGAATVSGKVLAQEEAGQAAQVPAPQVEEIMVMGRLRDAARSIIMERVEQPFAAEVVGVEQISRAGDSDVAMALRRVTGLSLVDGKFIYVRGLGERYSSATLNGAEIPSPELSRNVIPLDYIPASILESVKVHKAYSSDQPAAFGGGNVDIRTRGTPDDLVFDVSVGAGWNTENSGDGLRNLGDQGDLPEGIMNALNTYQGDISPSNITRFEYPGVGTPTEAQRLEGIRINRELLRSINRDVDIESTTSLDPDTNASVTLGNAFDINNDLTFGVLANGAIGTSQSNSDQFEQSFSNPDETFRNIQRTFTNDSLTAALNLSLSYQDRHTISTNTYLLQDDEDQASIVLGFNPDFQQASGRQRKTNVSRLEQRELFVNQVVGEHSLEAYDLERLPMRSLFSFVNGVDLRWFYSDAQASTNVPNSSSVQSTNILDPGSQQLISTQVNTGSSAQFAFLELEDSVESWGYQADAHFDLGFTNGTVSGGYNYSEKAREYYGYTANIVMGPTGREGLPSQVFSDDNLADLDNGFFLNMGSNFGTESYVAGESKIAAFGMVDSYFMDNWRMTAGVRWEDFSRGVIPLNLLDYSGDFLNEVIEDINQPDSNALLRDDDFYPSVALTYMQDGLFGTDNFQVRLGYGKTVVRPDLREYADIQFIDPELNDRVQGNPNLSFSDIDHFDLRTEMFFDNGDNLTVSLFYKDISSPIERVERPGPQDARLLSFDNAEAGEIYGVEFEGLKNIGRGFFVSGNLVLSDSELTFDASSSQTSLDRRLTGHSEYVVNTQLGFDSDNGRHAASLLYNVFGERVFFGGRNESPDAFENPFHSLDLTYSYFPTDRITVRLRAQNLLDENREFYQDDVKIIDVATGSRLRLDLQWKL
ncbi:MAG: TonB-dependent receptor [Gammaproteobacteria bacterium]|nr:TonB-dependent receptor [Gammaproteobacteria bacterium]MBJ56514.1 TonB-dependent receptor [Gammaproteobacteria bacterium]|tara:strand:+ start:195 stop:2876 length:2682 start_codon:yes stop_codon:yes gene_type:complete